LLYGQDARLPTALNFFVPVVNCPTVETDYARELFKELKRARQVARKNIQSAQGIQKNQYDKRAHESKICAGDLVMLKVEPRFKLDRSYKGPYRAQEVTATNATIQLVNEPDSEPLIVSLQWLSPCNGSFSPGVHSWRGHLKQRICPKVRRPQVQAQGEVKLPEDQGANVAESPKETRRGRLVRKPARYCPKALLFKGGEVVKDWIMGDKCEPEV